MSFLSAVGGFTPVDATGGTTVTTFTDSAGIEYQIHAFENVGTDTFTVNDVGTLSTVDVLVVAGGGSGAATPGEHKGGGGGAGGLVFIPSKIVDVDNYAITVGAGGASVGQTSSFNATQGNPGQDTTFDDLIALGGGRGGQQDASTGSNDGGSGGGGHYDLSGGDATQPASPTGGFGNDGGSGGDDHGRGGGGAGTAGRNSDQGTEDGRLQNGAWSGGQGLFEVLLDGTTYNFKNMFGVNYGHNTEGEIWFAGGGGGGENNTGHTYYGAGGHGGGGRGAYDPDDYVGTSWGTDTSAGEAGMTNTGGGGGGARQGVGGAGGSGIVLIRYPLEDPS